MRILSPRVLASILAVVGSSQAFASLTTFQTYSGGDYGVSTSGFGSTTNSGTILTSVPVGATLVSAYLYSAYYNFTGSPTVTPVVTLDGTSVSFGPQVTNATACCGIGSVRADVTSIVATALATAGGPSATPFGLSVTENPADNSSTAGIDGEMLVTVYKYASGPDNTVSILDGYASVTGDTAVLTLGAPATSGLQAQMMIGDSFSCCGQESTITVNGTVITNSAGNNDDCVDGVAENGCLITVGTNLNNGDPAYSDPFSPLLPDYDTDHERYDLASEIAPGDTQIMVDTINSSEDDNIFAAVFEVSGDVVVSTSPEPSTWLLFGAGLAGLAFLRFRRKSAV